MHDDLLIAETEALNLLYERLPPFTLNGTTKHQQQRTLNLRATHLFKTGDHSLLMLAIITEQILHFKTKRTPVMTEAE